MFHHFHPVKDTFFFKYINTSTPFKIYLLLQIKVHERFGDSYIIKKYKYFNAFKISSLITVTLFQIQKKWELKMLMFEV